MLVGLRRFNLIGCWGFGGVKSICAGEVTRKKSVLLVCRAVAISPGVLLYYKYSTTSVLDVGFHSNNTACSSRVLLHLGIGLNLRVILYSKYEQYKYSK
jgi:hypothetical protein